MSGAPPEPPWCMACTLSKSPPLAQSQLPHLQNETEVTSSDTQTPITAPLLTDLIRGVGLEAVVLGGGLAINPVPARPGTIGFPLWAPGLIGSGPQELCQLCYDHFTTRQTLAWNISESTPGPSLSVARGWASDTEPCLPWTLSLDSQRTR